MNKSRSLSPVERVLWKLDRAGSMNFTMVVELDSPIEVEALRGALHIESIRNPRLGARITDDGSLKPILEFDPAEPMSLRVVERSSDDIWLNELELELNQPMTCSKGPLARAVLVKGEHASELLLTLHHVIGDATAALLLARNILKLICTGDCYNRALGKVIGKTDALEHAVGLDAMSFGYRLRTAGFAARQIWSSVFNRPERLLPDADAVPADRTTRVIHKLFSEPTTASLIRAAKKNDTTIHGALCASMMIAAYTELHSEGGKGYLACMSPINMRKYCAEPSAEEVGFYVSSTVAGAYLDTHMPFWVLAKQLADTIHGNIRAGEPLMFLKLQGSMSPSLSPEKLAARVEKMISAAVGVTNVGLIDIGAFEPQLRPKSVHYSAAVNAIAGTGFLCSALTYGDCLTLNFQYAAPLLDDARAKNMADRVVKVLQSIAGQPLTISECSQL